MRQILTPTRSAYALVAPFPVPEFFPKIHYMLSPYLVFDLNWPAVAAALYIGYYFLLEPFAAVSLPFLPPSDYPAHQYGSTSQLLYVPQLTLSLLTATAFSYRGDHNLIAGALHVFTWIAQFYGHGVHEKRAPALLDNLVGGAFCSPRRVRSRPI
jgi:hypothetical protein